MSDESKPAVVVEVETEGDERKELPPGAEKAEAKREKDEVSFGRGTAQAHCARCDHYTWAPYDRGVYDGSCELVKGSIAPSDWCKLYAPIGAAKSAKGASKTGARAESGR